MPWEIKDISDKSYFAIGDIYDGMDDPIDCHKDLVVSTSWMKKVYKTNLHHELLFGDNEIDEDLQEIFDIGSAFHTYVLEHDKFYERYHVSNSPDATKDTARISELSFEFIEKSYENIQIKYPNMVDGLSVELAIFGEIDGVPVKCKIDKLNIESSGGRYTHVEIVDLKSVYFQPFGFKKDFNGERRKLRYMLSDVGYDIQAYFYTTMVEHWLESEGQHCMVRFSLLTASKENYEVQKFTVGSEMMETGKMKFDSVWGDIKSFVQHGKDSLIDAEVL